MESAAQLTPPVELTDDPRFAGRVRRQALVGAVTLGLTWLLAVASEPIGPLSQWLLLLGWPLTVAVLLLSLRQPRLRYLGAVPGTLVSTGLFLISFNSGIDQPEAAGWWLITAGIVLGVGLSVWFWFRWLPVPAALNDPFSPGRWALIGLHATLVVAGLIVVSAALMV